AGRVELRLGRPRVEEADEVPRARVREGEVGEVRLDVLPGAQGEDEEAAVHAPGHDHAAVDEVPEGRGHDDPALVIDAVLELAERHAAPWRLVAAWPLRPTARCGSGPHGQPRPYHTLPQFPTLMPRSARCCGISPTRAGWGRVVVRDASVRDASACGARPAGPALMRDARPSAAFSCADEKGDLPMRRSPRGGRGWACKPGSVTHA